MRDLPARHRAREGRPPNQRAPHVGTDLTRHALHHFQIAKLAETYNPPWVVSSLPPQSPLVPGARPELARLLAHPGGLVP
jgi:hypothetical protein